jgi:hypothetical protein
MIPSKRRTNRLGECLGDDYENKIKIDNLKKDLAESNGYKYFFVYSDEDIKTKQCELIELIKKEISNSEKN